MNNFFYESLSEDKFSIKIEIYARAFANLNSFRGLLRRSVLKLTEEAAAKDERVESDENKSHALSIENVFFGLEWEGVIGRKSFVVVRWCEDQIPDLGHIFHIC